MREGEFREFPNLSPPRHLKNSPDTFTLEILKETLRSEEFMKNISFIIPVFNEEKNLRKTFAALNQVSLPRGVKLVEIIFIDNGSRDRTFAKLSNLAQESYTLPISIVSYKKRLSAKDAAKEGIKHSISKTNIVLKSDLSNLDKEIKKLSTKPKRKNKPPQVSVIMPVYNSQSYLDKAIKSVLSQTFRDFEFIIIDDHSSDKSWNIIKRYTRRSKKIRSFRNNKKMGLATSVK
ncbi:MAG: glycosyltransferase, partial [Patescibacteria group bacterium]